MTVNLEWSADHGLVSPYGELPLNALGPILADGSTRALFLLKPKPYSIIPTRFRQVEDDLSQADGTSLQPPYISGLTASLYVEYWVAPNGDLTAPTLACAGQLREMDELLTLYVNALRTQGATPDGTQRLLWQPTGIVGRRMITQVLQAALMTPVWLGDDGAGAGVTFALATPFPYAVDENITETVIADGATETVPNPGNADYSPVIIVAGPTTEFAITRIDTGEIVSYTGPDEITTSAEIDFFSSEIASAGDDLIADLDPTETFFFKIPPGGCEVTIAGADCTVQSRAAFL